MTDPHQTDGVAVVGLGYVGLPLIREACLAGLRVVGFDVSTEVVAGLRSGRSHVQDVSDAELAAMLRTGLVVSDREDALAGVDVIVICVPTPLDADGGPDLTAVRSAAEMVSRQLRPETLVVLESTTYPGTTDEVVRPILEASGLLAGADFALAFSPERIDPGNPIYGLRNTPKVVGGHTPACTLRAEEFYRKLCDHVVRARGTREAEMAKLLENTYRHVNIALVNEMAIFCHELGIDLRDAIDCAATKPFGFQVFYPGPGVGGHCIPIDPNYLSYRVRRLGYPFRFVELAQEINQRMPAYVVTRVQELLNEQQRSLSGARVLLLGVTYKPNVADQRESPAVPVAQGLLRLGADLAFHDPYVQRWAVDDHLIPRIGDIGAAHRLVDVAVLLQDHAAYEGEVLRGFPVLLDTKGWPLGNGQPSTEAFGSYDAAR